MRKRVTALELHVTQLDQRIARGTRPAAAAPNLAASTGQPFGFAPEQPAPSPRATPPAERDRTRPRSSVGSDASDAAAPPPPPPTRRAGEELRGALRRKLGRLDRRPRARARRHLHGAVLDRGRPDRPRRARLPRRPARRRADRGRRMDAPRASSRPASPTSRPRTSRASSPPPAPRSPTRRSTRPTRSTTSSCPAPPSCCSASSRSRRLPPRCCTDRRSPRSDRSARSSPRCWSRATQPNYWALYLYLAVVTAASFALARARLWRWLAITAVAFGALWMFPGHRRRASIHSTPHALHVVVGFALAAALLVSGLFYGPDAEPGEIDPVSSGALAAYLVRRGHAGARAPTMTASRCGFTLLVVATVAIAWRTEAAPSPPCRSPARSPRS